MNTKIDEIMKEEFLEAKDDFVNLMGAKDLMRYGIEPYRKKHSNIDFLEYGIVSIITYIDELIADKKKTLDATYELAYNKQLPEDLFDTLEVINAHGDISVSNKMKNRVLDKLEGVMKEEDLK